MLDNCSRVTDCEVIGGTQYGESSNRARQRVNDYGGRLSFRCGLGVDEYLNAILSSHSVALLSRALKRLRPIQVPARTSSGVPLWEYAAVIIRWFAEQAAYAVRRCCDFEPQQAFSFLTGTILRCHASFHAVPQPDGSIARMDQAGKRERWPLVAHLPEVGCTLQKAPA
jgi:hypothetical protein